MNKFIEVRNLSKVYQSGKDKVVALDKINLTIKAKEYLAIVGPSGAGKSTLLHILGGLELPTQGEVIFKDKNIYRMKDSHLCRWRNKTVGFVFQFYHLLEELTVEENIVLPYLLFHRDRKTALKKVQTLLKYLDIEDKRYCLPGELSGGQKQKVAIARALINRPQLILCDEPTGNLDEDSARKVIGLLERLNREQGKTIVIVTHNLDIAKQTKRVLYIKGGKIKLE